MMISARGLARTFHARTGPVEAVRGVDVDAGEGEIVGLLGPNGAGKTTTLRMLNTLLAPTAGEATIAGHDLRHDPRGVRSSIGYVPQGGSTTDNSVVGDELVLQARLFGLSKTEAIANADALLSTLDLDSARGRLCKQLSGGQRRRVDIALGLVHQPMLVFLDEPTTGLDPQSRANLWEHIRKLRTDGATVVLTTHYLDEADALCDRILVMDHGAVVAEGTPDGLKQQVSGDIITLEIDRTAEASPSPEPGSGPGRHPRPERTGRPSSVDRVVGIANDTLTMRSALVENDRIHLTVERGDQAVIPLLRALNDAGITPASLTVKRPSLDDVFLTLTGRSLRDAEETSEPAAQQPAAA